MKLLCEFVYTYVNVHQEMFQRSFFESLMDQLSEGPNRQSQVQGDSIIKTLPTVDAFWSFFSGRTGHFVKKKHHPKREILFCFAHGNGITFFDRNKQTSNKHTFVVLCFFFYWWQEPPFEKEMDQGRPVGGAWCGGRSCMSHGKGHEDPWNLSRECA